MSDAEHDKATAAVRAYDGAISVPELALVMRVTHARARTITRNMVDAGQWVPLGVTLTGARCYGPPPTP